MHRCNLKRLFCTVVTRSWDFTTTTSWHIHYIRIAVRISNLRATFRSEGKKIQTTNNASLCVRIYCLIHLYHVLLSFSVKRRLNTIRMSRCIISGHQREREPIIQHRWPEYSTQYTRHTCVRSSTTWFNWNSFTRHFVRALCYACEYYDVVWTLGFRFAFLRIFVS